MSTRLPLKPEGGVMVRTSWDRCPIMYTRHRDKFFSVVLFSLSFQVDFSVSPFSLD